MGKVCICCELVKEISEYYKHEKMKDGHLNKCKECVKNSVVKHRIENIEKIRAYDRERGKRDGRITNSIKITKEWRASDKRRMHCHNKVARAIKSGGLKKLPCATCGSEKSLAHHESYDRPLDVVWYCQIHHKERHKEMKLLGIEP